MPACPISVEDLPIGQPTLFGLCDAEGRLLMSRGAVIQSAAHREQLAERGVYIAEQDAEAYVLAMAGKLDAMLRQDELLGRIAQARPDAVSARSSLPLRRDADPLAAFRDLQMHAGTLLRELPRPDFVARLGKVKNDLLALLDADADLALLLLIDATTHEVRQYSATHSLLVAAVCELTARQLPDWPAAWRPSLCQAALTMNIAMTALQDQLAQQSRPPDAGQRSRIDAHARCAAQALREAGIEDTLWTEAVAAHHDAPPGALTSLPPALQLARLIRRVDIFAARLSPRRNRAAQSGAAAAKSAYLNERAQADEVGTAIVKATGIYPPGSYVRLASAETAVVLRRGSRANEPFAAIVLGRSGTPVGEPALRNTRLPRFAVTAGVPPQELRLRLNLARLLRLY